MVRLDYFLVSTPLAETVSISASPRVLSDHSPLVVMCPCSRSIKAMRAWTFDRKLLYDQGYQSHMRGWLTEFLNFNRGTTSDTMVWDALKAAVRGETKSYALFHRRAVQDQREARIEELRKADIELSLRIRDGTSVEEIQHKVAIIRAKILESLGQDLAAKYLQYRTTMFEFGENSGRVLAKRLQQRALQNSISKIQDHNGAIQSTPEAIVAVFGKYYAELYTEGHINIDPSATAEVLLAGLDTVKVTTEQNKRLSAPIQWEEVEGAINALANGKAAGPDAIPLEFLKIFLKELSQDLLIIIRAAQRGVTPASWRQATIILVKKKGKSELNPSSYRPISILNSDSKIFSKIMAVRLAEVITPLVSLRQHGFIPGRDTADHVKRVIALLDWAQTTSSPLGVILLDAEKAFDRVTWGYL